MSHAGDDAGATGGSISGKSNGKDFSQRTSKNASRLQRMIHEALKAVTRHSPLVEESSSAGNSELRRVILNLKTEIKNLKRRIRQKDKMIEEFRQLAHANGWSKDLLPREALLPLDKKKAQESRTREEKSKNSSRGGPELSSSIESHGAPTSSACRSCKAKKRKCVKLSGESQCKRCIATNQACSLEGKRDSNNNSEQKKRAESDNNAQMATGIIPTPPQPLPAPPSLRPSMETQGSGSSFPNAADAMIKENGGTDSILHAGEVPSQPSKIRCPGCSTVLVVPPNKGIIQCGRCKSLMKVPNVGDGSPCSSSKWPAKAVNAETEPMNPAKRKRIRGKFREHQAPVKAQVWVDQRGPGGRAPEPEQGLDAGPPPP
mmetsp:Transcript_11262/g.15712  ORF Transcript_11262/g.15712 Transcript_11262/m.15712 type:complete len:374 (+) Transcript_11262:235-1356(+)|eukprot:CAMPEP_0184491454 /NCGR_PEP_ID=MMETSP0113_2-20130426/20441_1 /TAXON_ID=91329 /ORGANISM="Norrisiella sphaerica, Strain BC52" /LENGTH=373 /DNA_ID=CAMNT_0026875829 /DNA_START=163 /DNA_END=1284 /DNA_ORIENTATION=+